MAQTRSLPRICIALGLPDVATLLDHARREAEAGEAFLEFRVDFLPDPCKGAMAITRFLEQFPDCTILATCRRHQNHGKFNGSIEEQLAILDTAVRSGMHLLRADGIAKILAGLTTIPEVERVTAELELQAASS